MMNNDHPRTEVFGVVVRLQAWEMLFAGHPGSLFPWDVTICVHKCAQHYVLRSTCMWKEWLCYHAYHVIFSEHTVDRVRPVFRGTV